MFFFYETVRQDHSQAEMLTQATCCYRFRQPGTWFSLHKEVRPHLHIVIVIVIIIVIIVVITIVLYIYRERDADCGRNIV